MVLCRLLSFRHSTMLDFSQHFSSLGLELPKLRSVHLRDVQDVRTHLYSPSPSSPFKWLLTPKLRRSFITLSSIDETRPPSVEFNGVVSASSSDAASLLNSCAEIVKCDLQVLRQSGSANLPKLIELRRLSLSLHTLSLEAFIL